MIRALFVALLLTSCFLGGSPLPRVYAEQFIAEGVTPEVKQALSTLDSVVAEYNRNRTSGINLARDYAPWPEQTNAALELVRQELER